MLNYCWHSCRCYSDHSKKSSIPCYVTFCK